jgi:holin-like protein
MIGSLAALLLFQLAGEILVRLTGLPLPGPVLGMILLFLALLARGRAPQVFTDTSRGLLNYLALLFVPAGVGIISYLDRVADEWLAIAITLIASTALAMIVTAFTLRALTAKRGD